MVSLHFLDYKITINFEDIQKFLKILQQLLMVKCFVLAAKTERNDSSKRDRKSATTSYPPEQLRIVRSRVKEVRWALE